MAVVVAEPEAVQGERRPQPELLAPAGDEETLRAALAAGADAVYLGLDDGFNARSGATNFPLSDLPAVAARVHRAGARLYLTLNTLIFESELEPIQEVLRRVARAGVDALLIQDPATALLARALCPQLELHASTQMTISSPEAGRFAKALGIQRVVLPRELSVDEIRTFTAGSDLEVETFVHGALCVSWSGQCLSSEAWGGRSANRGQCAQSCRMPYELVQDGRTVPTGEIRYLLSPKDLSALGAIPALLEAGVVSFKIEGRLKGPAYVVTAIQGIRNQLLSLSQKSEDTNARQRAGRDLNRMQLSFSRGFSDGFMQGADHQTLVDGRFPKHRGLFLGTVSDRRGNVVVVDLPAAQDVDGQEGQEEEGQEEGKGASEEKRAKGVTPLRSLLRAEVVPELGMGVVFDAGKPEDLHEAGGPLFGVEREAGAWLLRFGQPGPDLKRVHPGQRVWITSAPALQREAKDLSAREPTGRIGLSVRVGGQSGTALHVVARVGDHSFSLASQTVLTKASGAGLTRDLIVAKLAAFGGSIFHLADLDVRGLDAGLHLPVSELKTLRRRLVADLTGRVERGDERTVADHDATQSLRESLHASVTAASGEGAAGPATLVCLCRNEAQLDAVIAAGMDEVELDWMELTGLGKAVQRAKQAGLRVGICTVRVQKPGERGYDERIARLEPDAVLVRHWGGLMHFAERSFETRPLLHGDFSLNVTNSITALYLLSLGLDTVTASHDLDSRQLKAMLEGMPASRLAVTVHHHIPTFHTEHCVYARHLSDGRDWRSCGRPCDRHRLGLRDHLGREHPVIVDVGCRNTVFNAAAQSAASLVPKLLRSGVRRFRLEFVWESQDETRNVLETYRELLAGRIKGGEAVERLGVHEQFGVSAGTMRTLR